MGTAALCIARYSLQTDNASLRRARIERRRSGMRSTAVCLRRFRTMAGPSSASPFPLTESACSLRAKMHEFGCGMSAGSRCRGPLLREPHASPSWAGAPVNSQKRKSHRIRCSPASGGAPAAMYAVALMACHHSPHWHVHSASCAAAAGGARARRPSPCRRLARLPLATRLVVHQRRRASTSPLPRSTP